MKQVLEHPALHTTTIHEHHWTSQYPSTPNSLLVLPSVIITFSTHPYSQPLQFFSFLVAENLITASTFSLHPPPSRESLPPCSPPFTSQLTSSPSPSHSRVLPSPPLPRFLLGRPLLSPPPSARNEKQTSNSVLRHSTFHHLFLSTFFSAFTSPTLFVRP